MALNKVEICGVNTSKLPVLKAEEKEELFRRIKEGDEEARELYIKGNLRLVLSVIKRFQSSNENVDDLFQIGCIGLMTGEGANMSLKEDEAELGYWIGVPFWGRGLVTEAAAELISYGFEKLGLKRIWCGYFDGNERSRRVQEKCGFVYQKTLKDVPWELTGEVLTEHITMLSRERWQELKKKGEVR